MKVIFDNIGHQICTSTVVYSVLWSTQVLTQTCAWRHIGSC